MNCFGCLKEGVNGYCNRCLKELFDKSNISPVLPFNWPESKNREIFNDYTKRISISGVQLKYSLKLVDNNLELTDSRGQYILKPIPVGFFDNQDQTPANEHLTMQIARQIFKIHTPANALLYFKDRAPAYIVKRFDIIDNNRKAQQEDFAQIAGMTSETHGNNYKYEFSYEEIGKLIKKHISTYKIELEKFFRLVLFNYIFSNGDAHIKNFSVIQTTQKDYILSPAYDLLCTRLHLSNDTDLALHLFEDGFSNTYLKYGFYVYDDFFRFGEKLGIRNIRINKLITDFKVKDEQVIDLIHRSFLKNSLKELYIDYYREKIDRLNN